ncbi:hypothetical protein ACWAS6_05280 [Limosilactobacillus reuteri]
MKEFIWKHEDAVIVNALVAISVASINFAIAYAILNFSHLAKPSA